VTWSAGQKKFVFVGGMHRSGTSLIARTLAQHAQASGLTKTGVVEDEGQHLQSAYPNDETYGGPGEFALHDAAHLTELRQDSIAPARERLLREWSCYWDMRKPILVEKSPPNLVMTRFLSSIFPDSYFIMVMRHPVASALAITKWDKFRLRRFRPDRLHRIIANWLRGYEVFIDDTRHLAPERVTLVRYEDFVAAPQAMLERLWRFLEIEPSHVAPDIRPQLNAMYFARWRGSDWNLVAKLSRALIVHRFQSRVTPFGYSLAVPEEMGLPSPAVRSLFLMQ
jgi:Sulfotransferase family